MTCRSTKCLVTRSSSSLVPQADFFRPICVCLFALQGAVQGLSLLRDNCPGSRVRTFSGFLFKPIYDPQKRGYGTSNSGPQGLEPLCAGAEVQNGVYSLHGGISSSGGTFLPPSTSRMPTCTFRYVHNTSGSLALLWERNIISLRHYPYLGPTLDSSLARVFLPQDKLQKLQAATRLLLSSRWVSLRTCMRVLGLMVSTFKAVSFA